MAIFIVFSPRGGSISSNTLWEQREASIVRRMWRQYHGGHIANFLPTKCYLSLHTSITQVFHAEKKRYWNVYKQCKCRRTDCGLMAFVCENDSDLLSEFGRSTNNLDHNKNYTKIPTASNNRQNEPATRRFRRSPTWAGLTLSMTAGKSSCMFLQGPTPWNYSHRLWNLE